MTKRFIKIKQIRFLSMSLSNQKSFLSFVICVVICTLNYCNSEISRGHKDAQNCYQGEVGKSDCSNFASDSLSSEYSFLGISSKWEDGDIIETQDWIQKQNLKGFFSTCKTKSNKNVEQNNNHSPVVVIERLYNCLKDGKYTRYTGQMDSNMLPKGKGKFEAVSGSNPSLKTGQPCFSLMAGVQAVQAKFKNGVATGPGHITYNDGSRLEGDFQEGVMVGVAKLYAPSIGADRVLQLIGYLVGGRFHGPVWIMIPHNDQISSEGEKGAVQIHFKNGKIDNDETAIYVSQSGNYAFQGKLTDSYIIENPTEYEITNVTSWQCIHLVRGKVLRHKVQKIDPVRLPIKIITDAENGQVQVKNSQVIFFNPIARTGTETFMWLLHELKDKFEGAFDIKMPSTGGNDRRRPPPKMKLRDSYQNIKAVVNELSTQNNKPLLYARPYNFVNFSEHGSLWTPDYFSIVRDPIEKVSRYFLSCTLRIKD